MNSKGSDSQGMLFINDSVIHVENAYMKEVVPYTESTGYVLIVFGVNDENNMILEQEIRLNVGNNTIIMDESEDLLDLYDLEPGMRIAADFSAAMTRSIPPQSNAYRIVVLQEEAEVSLTTDRVVSVDVNNGFLLTGNPYDFYDQMIFTISDETVILDREGNVISLGEILPGQLVQVEHAIFQTLSIPPQSPAYRVQVL